LRDAHVPAGKPLDDAGQEHDAQVRREREHRPADRGPDLAHDQHGFAPDAVADVAPHRPGDQLAQGEHREERADDDRRRAEVLHEERHQWDQDAEAEDVDERDAEDRQQTQDHVAFNAYARARFSLSRGTAMRGARPAARR
jgi:hypothetical protein